MRQPLRVLFETIISELRKSDPLEFQCLSNRSTVLLATGNSSRLASARRTSRMSLETLILIRVFTVAISVPKCITSPFLVKRLPTPDRRGIGDDTTASLSAFNTFRHVVPYALSISLGIVVRVSCERTKYISTASSCARTAGHESPFSIALCARSIKILERTFSSNVVRITG